MKAIRHKIKHPFPFVLLLMVSVLAGCDKYEPRTTIEGVYYPNGSVHLEGRRAGILWPSTIQVTMSQPIRVSELGMMTYGWEVAQPGWKAEVARLEFSDTTVFIVTERLTQTGRFEYHERAPTLHDWMRNHPKTVVLLVLLAVIVAIVFLMRSRAEKARRARERERLEAEAAEEQRQREAEKEAERERQRQYFTSLVDLVSDSLALFEAMPNHLMSTEELLDQAESDFKEGAFAPFWDSVERAAMQLGRFDDSVRTITANAEQHADVAKRYEGTPPPFPIVLDSVTGMAAANTTADRMKAIVRKAQGNFQFATIFEQRKTNQLLVAGFTHLGQALDGMGRRIASSIDDLGGHISEMSSTLGESLQNLGSNLSDTVTSLHASIEKDAADRAERHKRALTMLDNIQRRRKPTMWDRP